MIEPKIPGNEEFRLAALKSLPLLDTPPEPDFDAVVQLGQALFQVPTCLISLIDAERQWFKACVGLDAAETSRAVSFCGHAILQPDVFTVLDATKDERFHDNPLVTGAPFIRFYAGAPILLPNGYTIGTVCILGPEVRASFDDSEKAKLAGLAKLALSAISLRALREDLDRSRQRAERYEIALQAGAGPVALLDADGRLVFFNEAFAALCPNWPAEGDEVAAALGLSPGSWTPDSGETLLSLGGQGAVSTLAVYPDPGGFLVTAAA